MSLHHFMEFPPRTNIDRAFTGPHRAQAVLLVVLSAIVWGVIIGLSCVAVSIVVNAVAA